MKTFTIGWLNKCRCGNKSHTVKTARGNETALWDDDDVKCNSCGRGGVIQVYEGQARVLWETDEEMAEGKPMSTITKQWLQQKIADMEATRDEIPFGLDEDDSNTLAAMKLALASLEAEPVCVIDQSNLDYLKSGADADVWPASRTEMGDVLLYRTAPPAPAPVSDEDKVLAEQARAVIHCLDMCGVPSGDYADNEQLQLWGRVIEYGRHPASVSVPDGYRLQPISEYDAMCAAMLQAAEPVTTAFKLRDAVEIIRNSGIAIDAEKILAERDALNAPDCWCRTCRPVTMTDMRFVACPECGNKRCPHANDHRNACTGSNEPGQEGSAYPAAPQQEA
ncbi:hypothetical protein ACOY5O_19685 [Enterobacter roggenkampii]|uniref:hypothetical protein n=1 Tax=Enterobacter roggenkampii TaxID=1812935 RepID=UPI003BBD807B